MPEAPQARLGAENAVAHPVAMPEPRRDRLFPPTLLAFLIVVGAVVGWSIATRHPTPDLEGAIELLSDGDLDGDERERMLLRVSRLAATVESTRGHAAGLLAAVSILDRERHRQLWTALGERLELGERDRRGLDLGDPMLGNILTAMLAETDADRQAAQRAWSQVAAQARMVGNAFAADLSAAGLARLR